MFNINDLVGKTKILFKFPIKCYVSLYGGLIISYLFCKNFVDDMFGMFIMFTLFFLLAMNIFFKIPSILGVMSLIRDLSRSDKLNDIESRRESIVILVTLIISIIICVAADIIMILYAEPSSLG